MDFEQIIKENSKIEPFNRQKVVNSIAAVVSEAECNEKETSVQEIASEALASLAEKVQGTTPTSSELSSCVIETLDKHALKTACKRFSSNREDKLLNRIKSAPMMEAFNDILVSSGDNGDSINTENANIDGFNSAAQLHRIGSETNKNYVLNYILPRKYKEAHLNKFIHIHDLDYFELNPNCLQIDLESTLKDGFDTGNGLNAEPKSIITASMLSAIVLQSSTNNMHGGQSLGNLDCALAKYVNLTYRKHFKKAVENYYSFVEREVPKFLKSNRLISKLWYGITIDDIDKLYNAEAERIDNRFRKVFEKSVDDAEEVIINDKKLDISNDIEDALSAFANKKIKSVVVDGDDITDNLPGRYLKLKPSEKKVINRFISIANKDTESDTEQAMQALCHNLNTMHSRAGDQVPFSSVNFGLDTSQAGRLVSKSLLKMIIRGAGNQETFIYPIAIFHVLEGISYYPSDPNYDLYRLAMQASSKRFYPNYIFVDTPSQFQYLRDKKGKLLWKSKERYYCGLGLVDKDELDKLGDNSIVHSNLLERIRAIQKLEKKLRSNKNTRDKLFNVRAFMEGIEDLSLVQKAREYGYELPVQVDELAVGADSRCFPCRMGCRTFVESDALVECDSTQEPENYKFVRDERPPYGVTLGRGNFNFVTMNLPKMAIEAIKKYGGSLEEENDEELTEKCVSEFYKILLEYLLMAKDILVKRQEIIGNKIARNFNFIVGEGLIIGSKNLNATDKTKELWDHFSKSFGFIGLYETMQLLYHKKQSETLDKEIEVIEFMRKFADGLSSGYYVLPKDGVTEANREWYKEAYNITYLSKNQTENNDVLKDWNGHFQLVSFDGVEVPVSSINELPKANFSVFATPAEGLCNSACKADTKSYGVIKNVTDKGYYTNSNHVDVREKLEICDKAKLEGVFHTLCNAGNIFYIEADGFVGKNVSAYKNILDIMKENEMAYCAVNIPVDQCDVCRYVGEIPVGESCPKCGNSDENLILRTRRITGYITGSIKRFNSSKRKELANRIRHTNN